MVDQICLGISVLGGMFWRDHSGDDDNGSAETIASIIQADGLRGFLISICDVFDRIINKLSKLLSENGGAKGKR